MIVELLAHRAHAAAVDDDIPVHVARMRATKKALENGCKEVLWLDAHEHKYVEEVGTSNAFFMIGDEIITAPGSPGPRRRRG